MTPDDNERLSPLQPTDDDLWGVVSSPDTGAQDTSGTKSSTSTFDSDDYTFTKDGLADGISIGTAKRYSPLAPKYRVEETDDGTDDLLAPWSPVSSQRSKKRDSVATPTFHGTTMGDVEDFLRGRIEYYKSLEESAEEREKREKRERRYKSLASIGDILGSFHKAYSHARDVDAMALPSMSDKAQARIDKARAEREKNSDRLLNYVTALDRLNDSKALAEYRQKTLGIRQQQQDRLDKQEETNRSIADARVKYYEAQGNKNDEQAAYWKTKAELLERGWPQEQAEQAARIEERKARAAKLNHDARAPYKGGGGGGSRGGRSTSSSSSTESDGAMLGRAQVDDPEGYKEAVSVASGGDPYFKVNSHTRGQVAGAYRALKSRKSSIGRSSQGQSLANGGKTSVVVRSGKSSKSKPGYANTRKLGL